MNTCVGRPRWLGSLTKLACSVFAVWLHLTKKYALGPKSSLALNASWRFMLMLQLNFAESMIERPLRSGGCGRAQTLSRGECYLRCTASTRSAGKSGRVECRCLCRRDSFTFAGEKPNSVKEWLRVRAAQPRGRGASQAHRGAYPPRVSCKS